MGARDLLTELAGLGVSVTARGDSLVIRPASRLSVQHRALLRDGKAELLAMLKAPVAAPAPLPVSADALAAVAWTDEDIARFAEREARLLRWGWPAAEAEAMAERLVQRDRQRDDRVSCTECTHYRPGRCGNHRAADLHAPLVARDMAALLQRCGGFEPLHGGVVRPPG